MIRTIVRYFTTKIPINPKPLAPNKPKASIDFVSKEDKADDFYGKKNISYRIIIFKMNLNFDLLLEEVAMGDRHFQKHFRINSEDLMEEMVVMVLTLSFKVKIYNTDQ
jgi:hypothetical protein